MKAEKFRADLFHRLNVYPLRVPPLRERVDDISLLAGYFCDVTRRRLGLGPVRLDPEAVAALKAYAWPGNVRELENVLSRVTLKAASRVPRGQHNVLTRSHLGSDFAGAAKAASLQRPPERAKAIPASADLKEATRDFQRSLIDRALAAHDGNWSAAARQGLWRQLLELRPHYPPPVSNLVLQLCVAAMAGRVSRGQQQVIDCLVEENRVVRQQLGGRRLRLTDAQRRRLAVRAQALERSMLAGSACIITPDTLLRWYWHLLAKKYDWGLLRGPGRAATQAVLAQVVVRMASQNPGWGCTRIRGALLPAGQPRQRPESALGIDLAG